MSVDSTGPTRACSKCGESYPETAEFFSRHKTSRGGLLRSCKRCGAAYTKAWRARNHEAHKGHLLAYSSKNRAKAAARTAAWKLENPLSVRTNDAMQRARRLDACDERVEFSTLVERDGLECAYCAVEMDPATLPRSEKKGNSLELDHLVPYSRGGRHAYANAVLACRDCNKRKNFRTPDEFIAWADGKGHAMNPNAFVRAWLDEHAAVAA